MKPEGMRIPAMINAYTYLPGIFDGECSFNKRIPMSPMVIIGMMMANPTKNQEINLNIGLQRNKLRLRGRLYTQPVKLVINMSEKKNPPNTNHLFRTDQFWSNFLMASLFFTEVIVENRGKPI